MPHFEADETSNRCDRQPASISLVLPAWNESEALPRAVREADTALRSVASDYEIVVVDDGSSDRTTQCLQVLALEFPSLRVLRHEVNQGYGAALRTGFSAARCDLVVFTDADVQFDLREIDRFVLLARDYDVVCGYRIDRQDSPLRCFYSRVYNGLVRTLVGTTVRDIDCAFKLFRREKLEQLAITTDGFLVNTELLTQASQKGHSIVEVGVSHRPRCEGHSTVSFRHIPVVLRSLLRFWWNNVQFSEHTSAAREGSGAPAAAGLSDQRVLWLQGILLLVAAVFLLTGLSYPLIDRDETRYAEIPREMLISGDWLVPRLNFKTYYDKPPLLYWACAASYSVFGVSEWSARLVPALGGLVTLALTIQFGNRLFNRRVGLLTGWVLLLSVGFLGGSRILLIDGLLTCCVSLSLFAACEAVRCSTFKIKWWLVAAVAAGLGFLAKGPIAVVLFLPPFVAYAWLTGNAYQPKAKHWLLFGGVATAIAAPWFVMVSQQIPDFAYQFFYRHNVERFGGAFHAKPIWFYLPVLLVGGHPWSFLALPCLNYVFSRSQAIRRQRTPLLGFMLLWSTWCFAFFTISRCKLPTYVLPAAPALALVVGKVLEDLLWRAPGIQWSTYTTRWAPWLATATTLIAAAGFVTFGWWSGFETLHQVLLVDAAASTAVLMGIIFGRYLQRPAVNWGVCALATLVVAGLVLYREMPRYAAAQALFGPTSPLRERFATSPNIPIVTVGHEWSEVPFYLNRNDISNVDDLDAVDVVFGSQPLGQVLVITRCKDSKKADRTVLPPGVTMTSLTERGRARLMLLVRMPHDEVITQPAQRLRATRETLIK